MKVILLDIDGVLSPTYSTQEDSLIVDIQWSKFKIPVRVAEFIRNVSYEVETIWASSWEYDSLEVSKELNLKIKQVIEFGIQRVFGLRYLHTYNISRRMKIKKY